MEAESTILRIAAVGFAGACGALARWGTNAAVHAMAEPLERWHVSTLIVNTLGCFAFGLVVACVRPGSTTALALLTGFLGAYTTFSAFAWDTLRLSAGIATWAAAGNVFLHVALGIAAMLAGGATARAFSQ